METEEIFIVQVDSNAYPVRIAPGTAGPLEDLEYTVTFPEGAVQFYLDHSGELPQWKSNPAKDDDLVRRIGEAIEDYTE